MTKRGRKPAKEEKQQKQFVLTKKNIQFIDKMTKEINCSNSDLVNESLGILVELMKNNDGQQDLLRWHILEVIAKKRGFETVYAWLTDTAKQKMKEEVKNLL